MPRAIQYYNNTEHNDDWMKTLPGYQDELAIHESLSKGDDVVEKGGVGSGHHGHSGRPGKVGGSVSGDGINKLSSEDLDKYYYHRSTTVGDTDAILKSGYIKGSLDNFGQRIYSGMRNPIGDSPVVFFGAEKSKLKEFHSTMTANVASNIEDTKLLDVGTLVLIFDPKDDGYYNVSNFYSAGIVTQSELIEVYAKTVNIIEKQLPIDEDSKQQLMKLRQELFFDVSDDLAEKLYTGELSLGQWEETMRSEIRQLHTSMAAIGAGGWDVMDSAMWGRLGTPLREQYHYLHLFAEAIAKKRDNVSLKYIQARSRLYGKSGGFSVVLMQAGAIIEDQLPYLPKDFSTRCLMNCRCQWSLTKIGETSQGYKVQAVWLTNPADHCEDCLEREGKMVIINVPFGMTIPDKIGGL